MKTSLLKTIRQPGDEKKPGKLNIKVVTFSVCLLLAIGLWVLNMMSKKYTQTLTFYINYQHLQKLYPSSDTLHVKVTTTGFRFTSYKFGFDESTIKIDASSFRHNMYSVNSHTHEEKIEEQLPDDIKVLDISPDTLYLRNTPVSDQQQN